LDHPAAFSVSEKNNSLNIFKRVLTISVGFIAAALLLFFLFEKNIQDLLVPRLPMDHGKTPFYYYDLFRLGAYELVWTGLILMLVLFFYSSPSLVFGFRKIELVMIDQQRIFSRTVIAICACLILINAFLVLEQFPNSSDEYVYLFQAETLSEGRLWDAPSPVQKSFEFNHIAVKDHIRVGRFPLGWPVILSAFLAARIPGALANPILAIVTLFVFYSFARKYYGERVAGWSLILLAASGFFMFNSASFFSHTSCLLETLIFVYCINLYKNDNKIIYGLLAGVALGLIMLIRYYTAVLLFFPFFITLLYHYRLRAFRLFVLIGIGALPCLACFLWYNYAVTGNPLTPVTVWGYQNEGLGFINGHTPLIGFEHVIRRFLMFNYWSSPVLLVLYFVFLVRKFRNKQQLFAAPEDYFFLISIIGYFFYYEIGGNQYGPRFYYEAFPFLILFVVNQVFIKEHYFARLFLYASFLIMVLKLPFIADREHTIVEERKDPYVQVESKGISHAVVLLSSGASVLRPMPIGDLTRNDHVFHNDVLYAISDDRYNETLMRFYKDRAIYKYVRKPERSHGILFRIR
jgi:hypothetical protein